MFGTKQFDQTGYPTPTDIPDETTCLTINIPASDEWWALITGLLYSLIFDYNWQQYEGGLSRDEAAAQWQLMIEAALDEAAISNSCPSNVVDTPYWDEASDVEDEATIEAQAWYGEVTNPTAPPAELDFVENALVWAFTGLIALATPELGFAPAIAFHTIAPKFLLAQKAGDIGEIIHIVLDGAEVAQVDTSGHSGEIMSVPIIGDPALDGHDILMWGELA